MIIRDFNLFGSFVSPHKTHSELIVDPYTVLPSPIIFEGFQTIPWGDAQGVERYDRIQLIKLSTSCGPDPLWTGLSSFFRTMPVKNVFRTAVKE
jgi:hypothetical protein